MFFEEIFGWKRKGVFIYSTESEATQENSTVSYNRRMSPPTSPYARTDRRTRRKHMPPAVRLGPRGSTKINRKALTPSHNLRRARTKCLLLRQKSFLFFLCSLTRCLAPAPLKLRPYGARQKSYKFILCSGRPMRSFVASVCTIELQHCG